jgi:hypothetical protein
MDELRESSLLFSLEGLLETERERVLREAREAQKRRDEELIRVAEAAERRRLALQGEREARERRELLEQERERDEEQRIEAMKRATIERARIEAEGKLRLVELEQARQHDLALAQLAERQRTARYRSLTWLSTIAVGLSLLGTFGTYFGWIAPAHARQQQQLQGIISANTELAKTSERALANELRKNQALSERIRQLEAHPTPPAPAPVKPPVAQPPRHGASTSAGSGTTTSTVCKDDGDPLNRCLAGPRRR